MHSDHKSPHSSEHGTVYSDGSGTNLSSGQGTTHATDPDPDPHPDTARPAKSGTAHATAHRNAHNKAHSTEPDTARSTKDGTARRTTEEQHEARPVRPSLLRGWRRKCPRCGQGRLLKSYLEVARSCPVCKLDYSHHRADDGPAYLTILLVGHLMAPLLHLVFVTWRPEPLVLFTIFAVGCVGLSLYLLPRLKGAIVGFQWARQMGGFGQPG